MAGSLLLDSEDKRTLELLQKSFAQISAPLDDESGEVIGRRQNSALGLSHCKNSVRENSNEERLIYSNPACELQYTQDTVEVVSRNALVTRRSELDYELELKAPARSEDLRLQSLIPIRISTAVGLLERNGRKLTGGIVEVDAGYGESFTLTPVDVAYGAGCCYPSSGQFEILFTSRAQAKGIVKFTGCGSAILETGFSRIPFQMSDCE
jgi:hypothetical protein